ncbi:MAG: hypothetical protein AB7H96_09650 [Vicinamibacterales bacterium]
MVRLLRILVLATLAALLPATARAEWQLKPFGGVTFGGDTTFVDLDRQAGKPKFNLGVSGLWLGEVLGIEGDVATTAGFFSGDSRSLQTLVLRSHVATVTGNVVVAMPRRIAQYGLRPYAVVGLGMMHVGFDDNLNALPFSNWLSAWDVGGGATGFLSDFVGVNWDVRLIRTLRTEGEATGVSVGQEKLSFWRATMGFTFRL